MEWLVGIVLLLLLLTCCAGGPLLVRRKRDELPPGHSEGSLQKLQRSKQRRKD